MASPPRPLLTRANATQANYAGRRRIIGTRLKTARSAVRCHPGAPRRSAQRPSEWSRPDAPDRDHRRVAVLLTLVAKARDQLVLGHRGATLDAEFLGPLLQFLEGPLLVGSGHPAAAARRLGRPGPHLRPGRLDLHLGRL